VSIWSLGFRGKKPTYSELAQAARANFRLASDKQLRDGCGLKRSAVKTILERVLRFESGKPIDDSELGVLLYLANRFIWKPAFTDEEVVKDFCDVLTLNKITQKQTGRFFRPRGTLFPSMH
jgi:hypothetical protein